MSRRARGALSFRNQRAIGRRSYPLPAGRPPGGVPSVTRGVPSASGVTQAGTPKSSESDVSVTLRRTGPEARTAPRARRTASSAVRAARSTSCVEKTQVDARRGAPLEDVEDEEAVARVEARGRLVEEKNAGLARQDAGEVDPLPFASREAPHVALLESRGVDLIQRGAGDVDVPAGGCRERAEEGSATEEDDVERRRREERLEPLRKVAEDAGRSPAGDAPERHALEEDPPTREGRGGPRGLSEASTSRSRFRPGARRDVPLRRRA